MSNPVVRSYDLYPGTYVPAVLQSLRERPLHGNEHQNFAFVRVLDRDFVIQGAVAPKAKDIVTLNFHRGHSVEGEVKGDTFGRSYKATMLRRYGTGLALVAAGALATLGIGYGLHNDYATIGTGVASLLGVALYKHNLTHRDNYVERWSRPDKPVNEGGAAIITSWAPTGRTSDGAIEVVGAPLQ